MLFVSSFSWMQEFCIEEKSGFSQKTVQNKQLDVYKWGETAEQTVMLLMENHICVSSGPVKNPQFWKQILSSRIPTYSTSIPGKYSIRIQPVTASFQFCPPPCWSRWRWRVVSQQLITGVSPSALPINYAAVMWPYTVSQILTMCGWNSKSSRLWSSPRIKQ